MQIIASLFALASTGMGQATERLLGWRATALPPAFAAGALIVALVMLAKVGVCVGGWGLREMQSARRALFAWPL